jgi:hypothetical protein
MPSEIFGEGIVALMNFFKMRPHKDTSLGESASVKVEGMNIG